MAIVVECVPCGKRYRVDDQYAGRKVRCKSCGTVLVVPTGEGPPPTPARATRATPTSVPPKPAPPKSTPPASAVPPVVNDGIDWSALEGLGDGTSAAPAAAAAAPVARRFKSPKPASTDPFVRFPGDEALSKYAAVVSIGVYFVFLGIVTYTLISTVHEYATLRRASSYVEGQAIGYVAGMLGKLFLLPPAVLAGLCWAGTWAGLKVAKVPTPPGLFWKAVAVVLAPLSMTIALQRFKVEGLGEVIPPWWLMFAASVVMLWAVLRLKPVRFLPPAIGAIVLTLGPIMLLLASINAPPRSYPRPTTTSAFHPSSDAESKTQVHVSAPAAGGAQKNSMESARTHFGPTATSPGARDLSSSSTAASEADDIDRLRRIGAAVIAYGKAHGRGPMLLDDLIGTGSITSADVREPSGPPKFTFLAGGLAYPYPTDRLLVQSFGPRVAGKFLMLFGDGRVESIPSSRYGEVMQRSMRAR